MDDTTNSYHISFFRPTTKQALANRNLVLWLVSIWFIAIFGFHFVLRAIEKPVPEPVYTEFLGVWENVSKLEGSEGDMQLFGKSVLSVLGKIALMPEEKSALDNALSNTLYTLTPDSMKQSLIDQISDFEATKASITNISDEAYIAKKVELSKKLSPVIGLSQLDIRSKVLPFELTSANIQSLSNETIAAIPGIMEKYLVHNQSVLTDTKFLGFPFHYFYSAVFLLILFVGLCYVYCVKIDRLNKKLEIAD